MSQKIAHGDFQTPQSLADDCCRLLVGKIKPRFVIEPTCGLGNFLQAANNTFGNCPQYIGFDINSEYIKSAEKNLSTQIKNLNLTCADFFSSSFYKTLPKEKGPFLLIGNPPWVTSSTLGAINIQNSPEKKARFKNGFDNISGRSNFDISEWMIEQLFRNFYQKDVLFAFILKSSVARKLFQTFSSENPIIAKFYRIDAFREFGVSVDAGLFLIEPNKGEVVASEFIIYSDLKNNITPEKTIIQLNGRLTNKEIQKSSSLRMEAPPTAWRSGLKHDCSKIMEFQVCDDGRLMNGFGKTVTIEPDLLFPLLKSSDIANSRLVPRKMVLVPQKYVGEDTSYISNQYPKTWKYLLDNGESLDSRKSSIYKKAPRFAIFGIGSYSFKPWKIAISGLYKKIAFQIIGPIDEKPCMFDDTCYFVSCDSRSEAEKILSTLESNEYIQAINSIVFWDSKRPITASVLNSIDYSTHWQPITTSSNQQILSNVNM